MGYTAGMGPTEKPVAKRQNGDRMTWSISATGKKADVIEQVKAETFLGAGIGHEVQAFAAARDLVLAQISCVPEENVDVHASGHLGGCSVW
jgi:hypothetical protein